MKTDIKNSPFEFLHVNFTYCYVMLLFLHSFIAISTLFYIFWTGNGYVNMNLLFFLCGQFAGTGKNGSSGDGEHSRAPADVQSFSYFIPVTHNNRVWSANIHDLLGNFRFSYAPLYTNTNTTSPYARIERVIEVLCDVKGVPGH